MNSTAKPFKIEIEDGQSQNQVLEISTSTASAIINEKLLGPAHQENINLNTGESLQTAEPGTRLVLRLEGLG